MKKRWMALMTALLLALSGLPVAAASDAPKEVQMSTYTWNHIRIDVPAAWTTREVPDVAFKYFYVHPTNPRKGMLMLMEHDLSGVGVTEDNFVESAEQHIADIADGLECNNYTYEETTVEDRPAYLLFCDASGPTRLPSSSILYMRDSWLLLISYISDVNPDFNTASLLKLKDSIHYVGDSEP